MGQYNQLEGMPIYFLYFIEVHENVIFSKVYKRHNIFKWKGLKANFVLFFLEACNKIVCSEYLQSGPCIGKENLWNSFFVL
jgi:hypothetical protein